MFYLSPLFSRIFLFVHCCTFPSCLEQHLTHGWTQYILVEFTTYQSQQWVPQQNPIYTFQCFIHLSAVTTLLSFLANSYVSFIAFHSSIHQSDEYWWVRVTVPLGSVLGSLYGTSWTILFTLIASTVNCIMMTPQISIYNLGLFPEFYKQTSPTCCWQGHWNFLKSPQKSLFKTDTMT